MPMTSATNATQTRARPSRGAPDAIKLLKEDHREVEKLFAAFEKARSSDRKQAIAQQICEMLKVHAQIEEEIFYPAVREAIDETEIMDEAQVEHNGAKQLVAEIESASPDEDMFEAKVKVLSEYIKHHVKEEEGKMFRKARSADLDLKELGEEMSERKQALMDKMDMKADGKGRSD